MARLGLPLRSFALGLVGALAFVLPVRADDDLLVLDDPKPAARPTDKKVGFVALVPVGTAEKALAEQVTGALVGELKTASFRVEALSLGSEARDRKALDPALGRAALEKAEAAAAKGRAALERLNFGRAEKDFRDAIGHYQEASAALLDVTPVIEARLGLAEVYARQGQEAEAEAELAAIVRLSPEYELDAARYPPLFLRTHAKVRAQVLSHPKGSILVDRTGNGSEVRVDGRRVGTAPIRVTGVVPGKHHVRVFRENEGLFGALVEVKPGEEAVLTPGFFDLGEESPLQLLASNRFTPEAAKRVASAARAAGMEAAVVGAVGRTDRAVPTVLLAIDAATGDVVRIGPLSFDGDLLNLSIEALKAREGIERALSAKGLAPVSGDPLVPGVRAAAAEIAEVALRFDVRAPEEPRRPRGVVGGAEAEDEEERARRKLAAEGGGDRAVLSTGGGGRTKSLIDDEDPFAAKTPRRQEIAVPEDAPLLEQPWFLPTAIGGGLVGAALLGGGTYVGLVAFRVLPDPRPRSGLQVQVVMPEAAP